MVRRRFHNSLLFLHMLIQMIPLHAITAYFLNTRYNTYITPPLMLTSSRLCFVFSTKAFHACPFLPMRATYVANLIFLDYITQNKFGEI